MDCEFHGVIIPAGEAVTVEARYDEDAFETLHFTQAALGVKPKPGAHVVFVEKDGQKFAIGTLEAGRATQFSCDITFAMGEVSLSHSGAGEVHLTGYRLEQMHGGSDDDEYGRAFGSSDEEGSEEELSSDDEEAPAGLPLHRGGKPPKPRARSLVDDEAEEASSEEEEEESEEEDSEDEDMQDEDEGPRANGGRGARAVRIEDSSDEEEESGEEESEEEPPAKQQRQQGGGAAAAAGAKRPAQQAAAQTPQPAKKAKGAEVGKAPATAPAKVAGAAKKAAPAIDALKAQPQAQATPANDQEYLQALKAALRASGPMKLATLGTKVKRPPNAPKQKHFIDRNPAVFKYDKANDVVTLKE